MTGSYGVRSMLLAVTIATAPFAGTSVAFAQTTGAPRTATRSAAARDAGAPAPRARVDNPGSFHEGTTVTSENIGSGQAPSTATGPSGELAGSSTPPPGEIVGPIGPGDAARLIRAAMPRLQPCYDRALATHPGLHGRLELRFTIQRRGRVIHAVAVGMPEAPEVGTCLVDVLRQTTFPVPENGTLQLFYPLQFNPPARARGARPVAAHSPARPH